jgi:hypothetical protein
VDIMIVWMRALCFVALACVALTLPACAKLHARTEPISPPLEIPSPPPREITATEAAPLTATATVPPATAAADPPAAAPQPPADLASRRPARATPPTAVPAPRAEKPEGAPAPARPAQSGPPSPTLQTTPNVGEAEQKVRATIAQASRDLGRIETRALNAEAKAQFDIARRFVQQAGEALTAQNFVFAGQLADKAATIAALLVTR